jgi:hypothetical protein
LDENTLYFGTVHQRILDNQPERLMFGIQQLDDGMSLDLEVLIVDIEL